MLKPLMKVALRIAPAIVALLIGGCALPVVGPDYQLPNISLPQSWSATSVASVSSDKSDSALTRWWTQFEDPQLDWLIEQALAGSLDLKLAQARLQQARARRQLSEARLYQSVYVSSG